MTKISKKAAYPVKNPVRQDYFVGTDSENNGKTVNFDFEKTAKLINELNGTSIVNYLFKTDNNIPLEVLTEGVFLSEGNETTFADITKLYINKKNFHETDMAELFQFIFTNKEEFKLKIRNSSNLNNAVYFTITGATEFESYFTLDVAIDINNAAIPELIHFNVYFFDFELASASGSVDVSSKLDKASYTGNATDIDNRIIVLENQTDVSNVFIEMKDTSFTGNVLTIFSGWIWKLLGVIYSNNTDLDFIIAYSASGKTRLVYIIPDDENGFYQLSGPETFGTAQAPTLPSHGLYVTFFIVTDSSIEEPEGPNINKIPSLQEVLSVGFATTKWIWFFNNINSLCTRFGSDHILFQKLESVFNFIRADNTTESYTTQLPNKLGGAEETFSMVSDLTKNNVGLGSVDNTSDANKPVSTAQQTALDLKVDKVTGKGLSTEDYTTSEKNKLASIDATHYLAPLSTTVQLSALPQATLSDKARVYVENDLSDYFYDATASSGDIAPDDQTGGIGFWRKVAVGGETGASIKTKYESQADTNAFTDALKAKLDSITEIFTTALKGFYDIAYTHSQSAHAPTNAQKNSDITKAEIEAKLTGEITTHTHPAVGGVGDMVLASTQTVSGLKTFLSGMFGLRNVANTFTSFFTNSNTAARTYTLQNRDGTLLDTTDLAAINTSIGTKMANPSGTANYLSKFLTATTIGLSRLWDTGTYLGIGTTNTPTKDITLGNQANREIGVEESDNTTKGRDLINRAGRTVNYISNSNFNPLNQTVRGYGKVAINRSNGNVYVTTGNNGIAGSIYVQIGGTGNFSVHYATADKWKVICVLNNGDILATATGAGQVSDILKQTGGTGSFVGQGQGVRAWSGIAQAPNGDVYACVYGGDIYKQTGGTGSFVALGGSTRQWNGISISPLGDVFACVYGGDIYKQTGGTGSFVGIGTTVRNWMEVLVLPNNDLVAFAYGTSIFKQVNSTGAFIDLGQTGRVWTGMDYAFNGNIYASVNDGDIYMQQNNGVGTPNLDGGALKQIAGTGKGTGKSRFEIYTGQKTVSGTDMQVETLRGYFDENGYFVHLGTPVYANDAAADADTNLPTGAFYKITGSRITYQKP